MSELVDLVIDAHHHSALRGNLSHQALHASALGSGDYFKAIAAALLTLGGLHAPLAQTYALLSAPDTLDRVTAMLACGRRVPGWGNGFVRGDYDPLWEPVRLRLQTENPALTEKIVSVTDLLHANGKQVYPNPSCFTAAVALHERYERDRIGILLVLGRLTAWTDEYVRVRSEAPDL